MTEKTERVEQDGITAEVRYRKIKNCYLRVLPPDGRVVLSVPEKFPRERVLLFLSEKEKWIRLAQARCTVPHDAGKTLFGEPITVEVVTAAGKPRAERTPGGVILYVRERDPETEQKLLDGFYRKELETVLLRLLPELGKMTGRPARDFRIREMKTRWGSCNTRTRVLTFNLSLAKYPPACLRQVAVHELCHLFIPCHDARFYALMDRWEPDWRKEKKLLSEPK